MKNKFFQIVVIVLILIREVFIMLFDYVKDFFSCKHKRYKEYLESTPKVNNYVGDYWMNRDRYFIFRKCKTCGHITKIEIREEEYIRRKREKKLNRIL